MWLLHTVNVTGATEVLKFNFIYFDLNVNSYHIWILEDLIKVLIATLLSSVLWMENCYVLLHLSEFPESIFYTDM